MTDQPRSKVIKDNPIGKGLDAFRASFNSTCQVQSIPSSPDSLGRLGHDKLQNIALVLLSTLQILPAARLLRSSGGRTLFSELPRLNSAITSDDFDFDRIKPLLNVALADKPDDGLIWDQVYNAVTDSTPPPRPIASSLQQTSMVHSTSSFANSSKYRQDVDKVLKKCMGGSNPLFGSKGWTGWPVGAKEGDVLAWFDGLIPTLEAFAEDCNPISTYRRKLLAQPKTPLPGSTGKRSMDIGFVNSDFTYDPNSEKDFRYRWSHILVPGELKSNLSADKPSIARIDLATYAREVLSAQDTRRFVLGFTLCGSLIRMSEEQLGFDPTIMTINGQRYIEIERNAYCKDDLRTPLVIKDSWQYTERDEKGELLHKATDKKVINVARYYYYETICASNYRPERSTASTSTSAPQNGCSSSNAGLKRTSSQTGAPLPPNKRFCLVSPTKAGSSALPNRVHRRVVLRDYGKSIYKASSRAALLGALEGCIEGHESLRKAGFLYRDILINNLMINEDKENPSWPSFLIDLDLAIKEQREGASRVKGKTGTRAFMAIGALLGERHSFMHDLESFFWVLFWICIHYNGPGKGIGPTEYDSWNYESDKKLVASKIGEIADKEVFLKKAGKNFTLHYRPLIPWVNRLRREVFLNGGRWKKLEPELYSSMKKILCDALKDLEVFQIA
ncbi:serine/threonine-protein kinase Sgk2 [Diaporthe sp. PMI_573]|nr:serine/threonine-protein kinase Sgk2 [Diaporthaceae sp. PMI_573]